MKNLLLYIFILLGLFVENTSAAFGGHFGYGQGKPKARLSIVQEWCGPDIERSGYLDLNQERTIFYGNKIYGKLPQWRTKHVKEDLYLHMMHVDEGAAKWWKQFAHTKWAAIVQKGRYISEMEDALLDALAKFKEKLVTPFLGAGLDHFRKTSTGSGFAQPPEEQVEVWVAFVTDLDPYDRGFRENNIEMFVTATTAPEFPGSIQVGISRNPNFYSEAHPHLSMKLHRYTHDVLKDVHGKPGVPRIISVRPLGGMERAIFKSSPPGSVSIGTKETLGNLGTDDVPADAAGRALFHTNRKFLLEHPNASVFAPPVVSINAEGRVFIFNSKDPDALPIAVGPGMASLMECGNDRSAIENFSEGLVTEDIDGRRRVRPQLVTVFENAFTD